MMGRREERGRRMNHGADADRTEQKKGMSD